MNSITQAGFSPVVFVSENPSWVTNTPCGPVDTNNPAKLAAFSTFFSTLAARYPKVQVWALYNEPDNSAFARNGYNSGGCFGDNTTNDINHNGVNDRIEFAKMLAVAWKAVHHANPNAQLGLGAVAYDYFDAATMPSWYTGDPNGHFNYNFLPEVFSYIQAHPLPNGERYMDLVLFNYFDYFAARWEQQSALKGIQAKAQVLQNQMTNYGLSFPLLVAESGVDSADVGTQGQAMCLTMTLVRGNAFGLRGMVWWTFQDEPNVGWYYGLVDANLTPKPNYYAYQTLTRELSGYDWLATRSGSPGFEDIEAYKYKNGSKIKFVLWSSVLAQENPPAPCASARKRRTATFGSSVTALRIVSVTGAASVLKDNATGDLDTRVGYIAISVGASPVFVQLNP